jgi:hypothetical protein
VKHHFFFHQPLSKRRSVVLPILARGLALGTSLGYVGWSEPIAISEEDKNANDHTVSGTLDSQVLKSFSRWTLSSARTRIDISALGSDFNPSVWRWQQMLKESWCNTGS